MGSLRLVPSPIARRPEELILDSGLIWVKKSQGSDRTRRPWSDDPYYWIISPRLKDEGATGSVIEPACWRGPERSGGSDLDFHNLDFGNCKSVQK
jgi:hypothetical protein